MSLPNAPPTDVSAMRDTYVGSHDPDGLDRLIGGLDELRFFSVARTEADIQAAYARGHPAP
jgi:hypothetical protein